MDSLAAAIGTAQRIALVSHVHPDGDAAGSLIGLKAALEGVGKQVTATLHDGVPDIFSFLKGSEDVLLDLPADADLCIVLDAPDSARTGFEEVVQGYAEREALGVIDHHAKGDLVRLAQFQIRDIESSSAAELVLRLCLHMGIKLTPTVSTALLTGMYTDTGGFQLPNTTTDTLEHAAELMRRGGKLHAIVRGMAHGKSLAGLRLLGIALERLRLSWNDSVAVSFLTAGDLATAGASASDISGIINEMNVLPGTKAAALFVQDTPEEVRGILRTSEGHKTNVGALAKLLGGGGHPRAAGFSVRGRLVEHAGSWRIEPLD